MAITNRAAPHNTRGIPNSGKREMTIDEFKQWLKNFDTNKDGRISKDELRKAIRPVSGWYKAWKNTRGVLPADSNRDGFIDDGEVCNLMDFAEQCMGVKIIVY